MGNKRRSPERAVQQAMRLAANETLPNGDKKIRKICAELVNKAMEGDAQAANIVFDRLEGKPMQQIQAVDEEGGVTSFVALMPAPSVEPDEWRKQHKPNGHAIKS